MPTRCVRTLTITTVTILPTTHRTSTGQTVARHTCRLLTAMGMPCLWRVQSIHSEYKMEIPRSRTIACFFLSLFSCNFDDQLSSNFSQICYWKHMLGSASWDIPSENTGLWQFPKVTAGTSHSFWVKPTVIYPRDLLFGVNVSNACSLTKDCVF